MFTSAMTHQLRRFPILCVLLLMMTLAVPASLYAGVVFIPILGLSAENEVGDGLRVQVEGSGPDLTGMVGTARFRDGATEQWTQIIIPDSTHAVGSSEVVFYDADGTAVVEIDLTGMTMTWLPTGTTFMSGVDEMTVRLNGRSRVVPD